jgi:signal transduction histidine kinase
MFCNDIPPPIFLIFSESTPQLLYYTHIPAIIVSLMLGIFVYLKNKTLVSKILFSISIVFSIWSFLNIIVWTNIDSGIIMFTWSLFGLLYALLYILCLYFFYVFIDKTDISFFKKIILFILLLPVIIFSITKFNLKGFDIINCEAIEGNIYTYYYYGLGLFIFLWIFIVACLRRRNAEKEFKKQITLLAVGIELFLFAFFVTGFLASYLIEKNVISDFGLEQYGLFGMTFFMAFLAYLIVRFKAFNIKLLTAQALVVAMVILIASQFAFIQNQTNRILTAITLIIVVIFGWWLVKAVKRENEQNEALIKLNEIIIKQKRKIEKDKQVVETANQELIKLDKSKTDFINIASHQLKKAPTPIKGYISLLNEGSYGPVSDNQKQVLDIINTANERQIHLVDDLLDIARMESGRVQLDFKKQKIEDICAEVYTNLLPTAKDKGLKLNYEKLTQPLPELMIDKNKMFESIFNFAENSIKYTPEGQVSLKLELAKDSKYRPLKQALDQKPVISGPVVRVTVADTGIGIPAAEIPYLFAKFSRGKDVSRLQAEGTGLGLYVVKLMIEAHGGRAWAESEGAGKGSRFIMEIPIKQTIKI